MIRNADRQLKSLWQARFASLPAPARAALRAALLDLRSDALARAEAQWRRHKAPMAVYWKVVGVYAGHLARAIPSADIPRHPSACPPRRDPPFPVAPPFDHAGRAPRSSLTSPWRTTTGCNKDRRP